MGRFGLPYMGSKDFICDKILNALPSADHFYDLFGGGFSVSHCSILMGKWKSVHYNEIKSDLVGLIKDAIAGKYSYENFKPPWISREDFQKHINDPYIRVCWSFGNNQRGYLFGKDVEPQKRSLHNAVIFDEFDEFASKVLGFSKWPYKMSIIAKRLYVRRKFSGKQLQRLQRLQRLQQLDMTTVSYDQVDIKPNSIVYCDPPYKGHCRVFKV